MAEGQDSSQEKTEQPTGKKLEDSRKKGKVAKSSDLSSALAIVLGILILYFGGSSLTAQISAIAKETFSSLARVDVNPTSVHHFVSEAVLAVGIGIAPILLGLTFIGLASNFGQVGFLLTLDPLTPKFNRLNPLEGIKRVIFSRRSMVELVKGLLKVSIVATVAYFAVDSVLEETVTLMDGDVGALVSFMAISSLAVGLKVGLAFLGLAVFDYAFQRFEHERDLKMTKQEIKEENKMMEGDPLMKSRVRSIQRQIAYKRMMQDVPKADVVVTNPTHFAVAIKYDHDRMSAPKVVAKGVDLIAKRIKEIAIENNIPIIEDKPLAQALYKSVDIGEQIPERLFQAVAQILAFVYRLKHSKPQITLN